MREDDRTLILIPLVWLIQGLSVEWALRWDDRRLSPEERARDMAPATRLLGVFVMPLVATFLWVPLVILRHFWSTRGGFQSFRTRSFWRAPLSIGIGLGAWVLFLSVASEILDRLVQAIW